MSSDSTAKRRRRKRTVRPEKPTPDFPLQAHESGHWSKRIKGRLVYFGKWGRCENGKLIRLSDNGNWRAVLASGADELRQNR